MKPLIKWPGGKARELEYIKPLIPDHDRYIEPFFGGGAVFFSLPPRKSLINDISANLMQFYQYIKEANHSFKSFLYLYLDNWNRLPLIVDAFYPNLYSLFICARRGQITANELEMRTSKLLQDSFHSVFLNYLDQSFVKDTDSLFSEVQRNLVDKLKRTLNLEIVHSKHLSDSDLRDNIETGFRSAIYMHCRNIYNDIALGRDKNNISCPEKIANFYFIREFCYGSMFRYNALGEFNIPYGGIAYNKKDFGKKVQCLFGPETLAYFKDTEIFNMDFEDFLELISPTENDFIFLDPPYDTDFSDYEGISFSENDQIRLANFLHNTLAKFILIIKNTDFIKNLYKHNSNITILNFNKQYTYNVRSRNNREAVHLIITNIRQAKLIYSENVGQQSG